MSEIDMTPQDFRKIALSFREAVESAHMNHPDFRVNGKIFATLGYPDENGAVVKLTPEEQKSFVRADPEVFQPVKGAWGRRGNTKVYLPSAKVATVREALAAAWRNTAPKRLLKRCRLSQASASALVFSVVHHLTIINR